MTKELILNQRVRIIQYITNPEEYVGLVGTIVDIIEPLYFIELEDITTTFPLMMYKEELEKI